MANTYTWIIESLDCNTTFENQTNVVSNIHWRLVATNGTYTVSTYGEQPVTYTAGNPFTDYANLTQDTVINWVKSALGETQILKLQIKLDEELSYLLNPIIITPPLPW